VEPQKEKGTWPTGSGLWMGGKKGGKKTRVHKLPKKKRRKEALNGCRDDQKNRERGKGLNQQMAWGGVERRTPPQEKKTCHTEGNAAGLRLCFGVGRKKRWGGSIESQSKASGKKKGGRISNHHLGWDAGEGGKQKKRREANQLSKSRPLQFKKIGQMPSKFPQLQRITGTGGSRWPG